MNVAKVHRFDDSLKKEKEYNVHLDAYFNKHGYEVKPTNLIIDMMGIDRLFISRKLNHTISVEYKTDHIAHNTNQFFCEVEVVNHPGWFYTTISQVLVVYIPGLNKCFWLDFLSFKRELINRAKNGAKFGNQTCPLPSGGVAKGIMVPLSFMAEVGKEYGPITQELK